MEVRLVVLEVWDIYSTDRGSALVLAEHAEKQRNRLSARKIRLFGQLDAIKGCAVSRGLTARPPSIPFAEPM